MDNIALLVEEMSLRLSKAPAIIEPGYWSSSGKPLGERVLSFEELQASILAGERGLRLSGVNPGDRVAVMIRPGIEFVQVVYSLFRLGATVVAVDPGLGIKGIGLCLKEAGPSAFIGITKAQWARRIFGWGRDTIRLSVTTGSAFFGKRWQDILRMGISGGSNYEPEGNAPAAILFTSGSTGAAKGVVYQHEHFHAQAELLAKTYEIQPREIDLPTFPLFGLFGPAMGMTSVIPEMDFSFPSKANPEKLRRAIQHYRVTNLFASPALLRRFSLLPATAHFPSLKRVLSAGAPVPAKEIASLVRRLVHPAEVHTPYGATEALPVATLSSDAILGETAAMTAKGAGFCVGRPVQGTDVRIIRILDEPIHSLRDDLLVSKGEIGEITVGGNQVTQSYFNRPGNDALAKIPESEGACHHRMGDLGYFDTSGRLWFSGRKSQRVQTREKLFHTTHCEGIIDQVPGVKRSALVGIGPMGEQEPVLCVEMDKVAMAKKGLAQLILEEAKKHNATLGISKVLFHPGFPMDVRHNSKINREQLALWAKRQLA